MRSLLIAISAPVLGLALLFLTYEAVIRPQGTCDAIFDQARAGFRGSLERIRSHGQLIGHAEIQELSERSERAARDLWTCCIAFEAERLDAEEFHRCEQDVAGLRSELARVARSLEAADPRSDGRGKAAERKIAQIRSSLELISDTSRSLAERIEALDRSRVAPGRPGGAGSGRTDADLGPADSRASRGAPR